MTLLEVMNTTCKENLHVHVVVQIPQNAQISPVSGTWLACILQILKVVRKGKNEIESQATYPDPH